MEYPPYTGDYISLYTSTTFSYIKYRYSAGMLPKTFHQPTCHALLGKPAGKSGLQFVPLFF